MASSSPVIALLSIKPNYANAILDGRKKVEFRKRPFKRAVTHVVIYATAPMKRIIGWFRTKRYEQMSPADLWERFATVGGISHDEFQAYFSGSESGVAIHVERPRRLKAPLALSRICSTVPPQSYKYLGLGVLKHFPGSIPALPPKRHLVKRPQSTNHKETSERRAEMKTVHRKRA